MKRATALVIFLCLSPFLSAGQAAYRLSVTPEGQPPGFFLPLQENESWCLVWNHSVAGFAVTDCFVLIEGQWLLASSHQPDFAAGLGHRQGYGELQSDGAGGYLISNIDEPIPGNRMVLRVGAMQVNHRLLHRDREVSLSEQFAGQRVIIHVGREGL
ncbi:DUF1850 domain-containing protein [Marinospirillum alkaliphilum]|uniref:DUF1850 domain-containing protein n=1 Tax=Marinospirillum alkaliphilum DSM 21637 TaxID=1122209 RepID=A0A1K1XX92_9GAMM|nr:DUF1850 domain-containing protein [Marinospirillum alkaliphilum]SFX54346.1 protein of unknown function [Marinospirillum alkaliphilum DSM 21637]